MAVDPDDASKLAPAKVIKKVKDAEGNAIAEAEQTEVATASFSNKYEANDEIILKAEKSLKGAVLEDGQFSFTLSGTGITAQTKTNNGTIVTFDKITYNQDDIGKSYTYTIKENTDSVPAGYTYDKSEYEVTVEVAKNDTNPTKLTFKKIIRKVKDKNGNTADTAVEAMKFENVYNASGEIPLSGKKIMEGREFKPDDKWIFTITPQNNGPIPVDENGKEVTSVEIEPTTGTETTFSLGTLKFDLDDLDGQVTKTFEYVVKESGTVPGVINDSKTERRVKVTVTDLKNGKLDVKLAEDSEDVVFTNEFFTATAALEASKTFNGWGKAESFTFILEAAGTAPMPDGAVRGRLSKTVTEKDKKAVFGEIEYAEAGTYIYTIIEQNDMADGVVYDTDVHEVVVKVVADSTNRLKASVKYDEADQLIITNTYYETFAMVQKVWEDNGDQDGKRPASITVQLLADGKAVEDGEVILSESNGWSGRKENLPKYKNGVTEEIKYTWAETEVPEGYTLTSNITTGTDTVITNTHITELTEATVKKVWNDSENRDGFRPATLTVQLSNGQTVTLDEKNQWTATIDSLPKYANGKEIEYSWTEGDMPEGYELTGISKEGTITTLTNTYDTQNTQATIVKVWDDKENQDGIRPEKLTVKLLKNGIEIDSIDLTEVNGWTATITDLQKYEDGKEIEYSWKEESVPEGYELTDVSANGTITTLTNTHGPAETEAAVRKVWEDSENQAGKRPVSLEVTLTGDGQTVETVTLNEANSWQAKVESLPKYAAGKEIIYTWSEVEIPSEYIQTSVSTEGTITTIVNVITSVKVSKVDIGSGEELEGAHIQIIDSEGNVVDEWTSTKEAHVVTGIKTGETYTLRETVAPEGYTITTDTTFVLDENGKVDTSKTTTTTDAEGTLLVEDAKTQIRVSKVDVASGEELEGATIQIIDSQGNVVDEWTSTKEAHVITSLKVGETYTLHETVAPEGYNVTTDTTFIIDETGKVTYTGSTTTDENGNTVLLVEDARKAIKVSKTDLASGEALEGATLQIIDGQGNVVDEWISGTEAHEVTGLRNGETYTLRETMAPDGYIVAAETTISLDENGKVSYSGTSTTDETGGTLLLLEDKMTEVRVSKVDLEAGEELEGAHIQILDKDGNVVEEWDSTKEAHVITGLKTGETYTLRETVAPEGYTITSETTFTIDETGKVTYSGTTTTDEAGNTVMLVEDVKTRVYISKTDAGTGEPLAGASIQILDKDGNVVEEWISTTGTHEVSGLKTGETYTLKETAAPAGYSITVETTFTIDETGKVTYSGTTATDENGNTVMVVEDTETETKIAKADVATGEILAGATLQILDKDGKVVDEWISTTEPHVVTGLTVGETYTLRETGAPEGYDVTVDTTFVLKGDGTVDVAKTSTKVLDGVLLVQDGKKSETASIAVTKHLVTSDGQELGAVDQTFYVQLFYDEGCTIPVSEIQPLHFQNGTAATVTFEGLEPGRTYYVKEVDENGNIMEYGTVAGSNFVVEFGNGNEVTISTTGDGKERIDFNNEFIEIPDGFYLDGEIEVTKNVLTSAGAAKNTDETFYVGFFDDPELTQLSEVVEYPILGLEMDGSSTISNSTKVQVAPGKNYTIYVAEVDEDGNPVSSDPAFAYTVTADKNSVTITEESLKATVTITNKEKPQATNTPTPTITATVTPTPPTSASTGDDTDSGGYLAMLGLAMAAMMTAVLYRRRREEEK